MMKFKVNILGLLFSLIFQSNQAQNWPKIYGDNFEAYVLKAFEDYDRGILIGGDILANSNTFKYAWIIKTDINGNVIWDKKYGNSMDRYYLHSFIKTADGGSLFCGATSVEGPYMDPLFVKLNFCGELEWCKIYISEGDNWATGIIEIGESYIGMLEYYTNIVECRISLVKMDQEGNPIWIQYLAQEDTLIYNEEGEDLLLTSDSNYLISGYCFHPGLRPYWIMSDTIGKQIWDLKWSNCEGYCFYSIEDDPGIFYGIGTSFPHPANVPTIFKFDSSGNEISKMLLMGVDTVSHIGGGSILKINDTTLLAGIVWNDLAFPNEIQHSEVFKLDTLGNLKDRRLLLYEDAAPSILQLTTDNKIIVVGDYVVDNNWDIYLWKMNSNLEDDTLYTQPLTYDSLCPYEIQSDTVDLDCSLFVNIDEIPTKEEYELTIKISPNPAKDWISLMLPDIVAEGAVEVSVFDSYGRKAGLSAETTSIVKVREHGGGGIMPVNRTISFNISNLGSGLYIAYCRDKRNRLFTGKFILLK